MIPPETEPGTRVAGKTPFRFVLKYRGPGEFDCTFEGEVVEISPHIHYKKTGTVSRFWNRKSFILEKQQNENRTHTAQS